MPNWCMNELTIKGPRDERNRFMAMIRTDEEERPYAIFQRIIPMPVELEGTTSPAPDSPEPHPNWAVMLANGEITQEWYDVLCAENVARYESKQAAIAATGYASWWEWQHANWGVKWGDSDTYLVDHDDSLTSMKFDTPWGPPDTGMMKVSAKFPTLTFLLEYNEPGMGFMGVLVYDNGEVIAEGSLDGDDYPSPPEGATDEQVDEWYSFGGEYDRLDALTVEVCERIGF